MKISHVFFVAILANIIGGLIVLSLDCYLRQKGGKWSV